MKGARVQTVVRVPVSDLAAELIEGHSIKAPLSSVRLDGDTIIFSFGEADAAPSSTPPLSQALMESSMEGAASQSPDESRLPTGLGGPRRRSRRSSKRNRMKTRGWNIVTKMKNSHGQTVSIYEPFVSALKGLSGSRRSKGKVVAQVLRANGNVPGPDSVKYYLENTLEYLASGPGR